MHSKTLFLAAAAFGAVNASPVFKRQASAVTSAVAGAATSATGAAGGVGSSVTSLAGGAPSSASSAAESATSAVESATSAAETAVESVTATETSAASTEAPAETAVETATATETATAATSTSTGAASDDDEEGGSELYPCGPGYLLTYAQVNQTLPIPVTEATAAAGEWADSPLFPEVSEPVGGTEPGATHTINVLGISIPEVLVNATANETSGFAQWVWNNTAPVSVPDQGIEISNYSTVFKAYDPDFTTTGVIGNTTLVQIFTNACSNNQNATVTLLETLANFELSQLASALGGNETSPAAGGDVPATTTAATAEVTATETDAETATQTAEQTAVETSSAVETVSETVPGETATATETAATETVESTAATETAQSTAATSTEVTTAATSTATTTASA